MRLLNVDTFAFTTFPPSHRPSYAIASHRWIQGTEATLKDVLKNRNTSTLGYRKVQGFVDYVKARMPLVKWLWIDTCCIDQKSNSEVGEAINSMFQWYSKAEVCLAYMEDVADPKDMWGFEESIWFRRGWTLQELLAPSTVIFLSHDWEIIGHKGRSGFGRAGVAMGTGQSLEDRIAAITKIPKPILHEYEQGQHLSVEEKLMWTANRETTREEDMSYCLLGILGVSMNIRYGGGGEKTKLRLMEKVRKRGGQQSTRTPRQYRVPFSLKGIPITDHFVPREADMKHLTSFFVTAPLPTVQRRRIFVVHGMGGMGKTQLCAEFVRAHQDHFSAIFWLDGSSRDGLRQAIADAARRLPADPTNHFREAQNTTEDTSRLNESFSQWLSQSENKRWLIVIDNLDREWRGDNPDPQGYNYRDFLPFADHGNVLITTRIKGLAPPNSSIDLKSVDNDLARELLVSRAGARVQGIEQLLPKLGGLPLALVQAGAYLAATGMTTAEYIQHYDDTWAELMQNQNQFPLQEYAEQSVLTTWKMSYEQVKRIDSQAAKLLDLWAFLYHGDIWLDLILEGQDKVKEIDSAQSESTIDVFPQATKISLQYSLGILTRFSLVTVGLQDGLHSVHPVLHSWCLHNSETNKQQLFVIALRLVATMANVVNKDAAWKTSLRLAAHARTMGNQRQLLQNSRGIEDECDQIACYLSKWESSGEVENFYLRALDGYEKAWGPEHETTLDTIQSLGLLYWRQGKIKEAEETNMRALQGQEKTLGPEHTLTLNTVNNLGIIYKDQGKMKEAEEMYMQALQGYEKALAPKHTSTLDTVNNLGILYEHQGKMKEAEEMSMQALQGYEKTLGQEHMSTLGTMGNLGLLYADQGKMKEAEEMFMQVLQGYEKALGPEHTSTLNTVNNLGTLYANQGKMKEAEEMYMQALQGYEKALGPDHTSTLDTVNNLGLLYADQGKIKEAEEMYMRALQGKEKALGPNHASALDTVNNIANIYAIQGKMKEAEEMYMRALQGKEKALGPEHRSTLNTVSNLGVLYKRQGKMKEAEEMYMRALQGCEKALGSDHISALDTVHNLGILYADQGRLKEAEEMYKRALNGYRKLQYPPLHRIEWIEHAMSSLSSARCFLILHSTVRIHHRATLCHKAAVHQLRTVSALR